MSISILDHPLFILVASVPLTLLGKWAWDRWLSAKSRVSAETCKLIREKCHDDLLSKIRTHNERLNDGDISFKSTRHYQRAVILTLLHICHKLDVDCDQLTKIMVDEDVLE